HAARRAPGPTPAAPAAAPGRPGAGARSTRHRTGPSPRSARSSAAAAAAATARPARSSPRAPAGRGRTGCRKRVGSWQASHRNPGIGWHSTSGPAAGARRRRPGTGRYHSPMAGAHDVIIVGGGLVGASLAIALDRAGLDTVLVEAAPPGAMPPVFDQRNLS